MDNVTLEKISAPELRDLIDQITHQLSHLQRSQLELLRALEEDPSDVDCRAAHEENTVVIERKERAIRVMQEHLKSIDMAYYTETYMEGSDDHPPQSATLLAPVGEYHSVDGATSQARPRDGSNAPMELLSASVTESVGLFL